MITLKTNTACAALALGAALALAPHAATAADMSVAATVKAAKPSIGRIIARTSVAMPDGSTARSISQGTGFVMDASGDLVTNCHVVSSDVPAGAKQTAPTTVEVVFADQPRLHLAAHVLGCDKLGDIAVVRVDGLGASRPALHFADMRTVEVGEEVVAVGFAEGLPDQPSVTRGIVSALHRFVDGGRFGDLVQTDAPINHGNSGGPLLNLRGEVVGINTYGAALSVKISDVSEATKTAAKDAAGVIPVATTGYSMSYARAATSALRYANAIIAHGTVFRPDFGITVDTIGNPEEYTMPEVGVIVTAVEPGSLAYRAGLHKNDIVYAVEWGNGYTYATPDEGSLNDALAMVAPGQSIKLRLVRLSDAGQEAAVHAKPVAAADAKRMYAPLTAPAAGAVLASDPIKRLFEIKDRGV